MKCMQVDISLPKIVSDLKVDRLVKSLDIRHVSQIPDCSGVSRTMACLLYMILNLYLSSEKMTKQLTCYNENIYHFIFQFSNDGVQKPVSWECILGLVHAGILLQT